MQLFKTASNTITKGFGLIDRTLNIADNVTRIVENESKVLLTEHAIESKAQLSKLQLTHELTDEDMSNILLSLA